MISISTCLIIMHALLDVLTLHRVRVIAKSNVKVNCDRSFKCYFNTPRTDSAKIIYNIRMFAEAGHTRCGSGR